MERLESRGEKIQFYWIPGHCGVEINERTDSKAKQSIKGGRDSQLLLPVADLKAKWEKKIKRSFTVSIDIIRGRGESYFERRCRNGSSPWFREIEMNCRAFVSIKCMRTGHSSLKVGLSRFNIVSTAEEHIVTCYATVDTVQIVNWFIYNLTQSFVPLCYIYTAYNLTHQYSTKNYPCRSPAENSLYLAPAEDCVFVSRREFPATVS
jgi:hypothetical protein